MPRWVNNGLFGVLLLGVAFVASWRGSLLVTVLSLLAGFYLVFEYVGMLRWFAWRLFAYGLIGVGSWQLAAGRQTFGVVLVALGVLVALYGEFYA